MIPELASIEVLKENEGCSIVDFWAPSCGTCLMLGPILEDFAQQYEGRVKFYKFNVDEHEAEADALGVSSLPTLVFFRDGKELGRIVGVMPKAALKEKIEDLIGGRL